MTPAQMALAWCYSRWFVGSTIIGATTLAQLKENIDAEALMLHGRMRCMKAIDAIQPLRRTPIPGQ
jgi:aryl-alcohol dehydrogenase-like predicted oxidoreductase